MTQPQILVLTDLSERSDKALERAFELAARRQAAVRVLHVAEPLPAPFAGAVAPMLQRAVENYQPPLKARAERHGLWFDWAVREGRAVAETRIAADELDAELIVVAHDAYETGAGGGALVGSTAGRLVRSSNRPVLVVKEAPAGPYLQGLALCDLSENSQHGLEALLDALPRDAELHVLYGFQPPVWMSVGIVGETTGIDLKALEQDWHDRAERELETFLGYVDVGGRTVATHTRTGPLIAEAGQLIEGRGIDVVSLGTRGHSRALNLLLGSAAEAALQGLPCDLIAAPPSKRTA